MRHAHDRVSTYGIRLNVFVVNFGKNSVHDELLVQALNTSQSTHQKQQHQQQNHRPQQQQQQAKNGSEDNKGSTCTTTRHLLSCDAAVLKMSNRDELAMTTAGQECMQLRHDVER
jgi:hypothetical protein